MAPRRASRTPARHPAEEAISESIFDSIDPERKVVKREAKNEPSIADVLARMDALSQRNDELERNYARADTMRQPTPQIVQVGEEPQLSLDGLPDPVTDAKAYASEILKRGRDHDRQVQAWEQQRKAASTPQSIGDPDALWEDFTTAYPTYTENETRIKFATAEVAGRMAKRGIDVQKYMYTKSDLFFKDVVKEYEKTFGKPNLEEDDDGNVEVPEPTRKRTQRAAAQDEDGDDGRTDGIMSGADNGPVPSPKGPKPGDFIKDLQDIQRRTGYF